MDAGQATKRSYEDTEKVKRLENDAHARATRATFPTVVEELVSMIGRRLTAYVASVKDARALDRWAKDEVEPQPDIEKRLRLSYRVALLLSGVDSPTVVKNWLIGLNPELDDQEPLSLLRDGDIALDGKRVLTAAVAFILGG